MFDIHRVALDWGGRKLILETGKIARQADGAALAKYGDTTVLATVVSTKEPREGIDFLPLTVNYQEKFYAAGRIPGGYFKREGRPSEPAALRQRLPLRYPGDRDDAVARSGERSRHGRHGGGLRRPDALRRPLHGTGRG